jgi:hypothetical protein
VTFGRRVPIKARLQHPEPITPPLANSVPAGSIFLIGHYSIKTTCRMNRRMRSSIDFASVSFRYKEDRPDWMVM